MSTTPASLTGSTTTTAPTVVVDGASTAHPIRRAAVVSGAVAAVAVTAVAAAAVAVDVPFAIDGEEIPLLGFTQMTVVGAVLGGLLAAGLQRWVARPQRIFLAVTALLTVLSCIPSVAMPPDVATKVVLVATHVLGAAIIVPALARQLRR